MVPRKIPIIPAVVLEACPDCFVPVFWQDDARAKIKIAAAMFPFRFVAVTVKAKKDGGGWNVEVFE